MPVEAGGRGGKAQQKRLAAYRVTDLEIQLSNLSFAPGAGFIEVIAAALSASGESVDACG